MEKTQKLQLIDQKLKNFIKNNIESKKIVKCDYLMSPKQLKIFYQSMTRTLYKKNFFQLQKDTSQTLQNERIIRLDEKQTDHINKRSSFMQYQKKEQNNLKKEENEQQIFVKFLQNSNKKIPHKNLLKNRNQQVNQKYRGLKQNNDQKIEDYYIRKVKNNKVIRYINLTSDIQKIHKKQFQNRLIKKVNENNQIKLVQYKTRKLSSFKQRQIISRQIKNRVKFRNSII